MTLDKARKHLFNESFLLGALRRRRAIEALLALPGTDGVMALAEALGQGHPHPQEILAGLARLAAPADVDKIIALWDCLVRVSNPALAGVLARHGWPLGRVPAVRLQRDILALAVQGAAPETIKAVTVFAAALPVADEAATEGIYGAWIRTQANDLDPLIADPGRLPGRNALLLVAKALGERGSPKAAAFAGVLQKLTPAQDGDHIEALWGYWAREPNPALAGVLARLGWPLGRVPAVRLQRDILALAVQGAAPETIKAVTVFAAALPVADEASNDLLFGAWVQSQATELEKLITRQGREAASPELEALHALVTGRLGHYTALQDLDGALLVKAYALAPEPFRARIRQTVFNSRDRGIKEAFRRVNTSTLVTSAEGIRNLMLVGDDDGLFKLVRSLRLSEVLELCEHWANSQGRPTLAASAAVVDQAVAAYRNLGGFQVETGPALPAGLVDLFAYWRAAEPSAAELGADLGAADPFQRSRGLYLGHERGLVDATRLASAARSEHWPERLIARLLDPAATLAGQQDHVLWINACTGVDATLLMVQVGDRKDYERNQDRLRRTKGAAAGPAQAFLTILCAFQDYFFGSDITVTSTGEATDSRMLAIEDAGEEVD